MMTLIDWEGNHGPCVIVQFAKPIDWADNSDMMHMIAYNDQIGQIRKLFFHNEKLKEQWLLLAGLKYGVT